MTARRRSSIPQKRRIFLGCEGQSERSYGVLLNALLGEKGIPVHIDAVALSPGAGSPVVLAEQAARRIRERERRFGPYAFRALLIDSDTLAQNHDSRRAVEAIAKTSKMHIVWQEPCHEALLLRHLPKCGDLRPLDTKRSQKILKEQWPAYEKPFPAIRLGERINQDGIRQAAKVEPTLAAFLKAIGLL